MPQGGTTKLGKGRGSQGGKSKSDAVKRKRAAQTKKGASFKNPKKSTAAQRVDDSLMKCQARMTRNAEMISAGKLEQAGEKFATNVVRTIAEDQRKLVSDARKGSKKAKKKREKGQRGNVSDDDEEDADNPWLRVRFSEGNDPVKTDKETTPASKPKQKRAREEEVVSESSSKRSAKAVKKAISSSENSGKERSLASAAAVAFG